MHTVKKAGSECQAQGACHLGKGIADNALKLAQRNVLQQLDSPEQTGAYVAFLIMPSLLRALLFSCHAQHALRCGATR